MRPRMKMKSASKRRVKRNVGRVSRSLQGASRKVVEESIRRAKRQALIEVPRDTEDLAGTIHEDVQATPRGFIGTLTALMPYAIYVHENMEAFHQTPTKAKFFSDPLAAEQARIDTEARKIFGAVIRQFRG